MPTATLPDDLSMYYDDDDFTAPFRVIRLDARGFGRSSVPAPGYPWSLEGFGNDLLNLMHHPEAWVRQTADRRLEPGKSDPRHDEWYIQQMSQTVQHVVLETLAYLATVDLTPILPEITTPALVMVGERSSTNLPDRAQGLAKLLPRGTLVEVPGASGYVQHSAPAQCVAIWRDFVKSVR